MQLRIQHRQMMQSFGPVIASTNSQSIIWRQFLRDVAETVVRLRALGAQTGVEVLFESFPNCIVGDPEARNMSRSGFGESHYLDDLTGDRLYPIRYIESELAAYGAACKSCLALPRCSGVSEHYARSHGVEELVPFQ